MVSKMANVDGRGKRNILLLKDCQRYRGPLRAKVELLFEKPIDHVVFKGSSTKVLCCKETFAPSSETEVLARFTSDSLPGSE